MKQSWLGVPKEIIEKCGAVSYECVSYMLDGIYNMTKANITVAISGIAGPTGETETKKVVLLLLG